MTAPVPLADLGAQFIRLGAGEPGGGRPIEVVATLAEAHGVRFRCPVCPRSLHPELGDLGHQFLIGLSGRDITEHDGLGLLWNVAGGTGLSDLSLTPSILDRGSCGWHGFVTDGHARTV